MTCKKVLVALKITFVGTQHLEENLSRIYHTGVSIINIIGGQYHVSMYVWGVKWTTVIYLSIGTPKVLGHPYNS